jgi:Zn finger protein HypA/HybF involved in hydrogenase expression
MAKTSGKVRKATVELADGRVLEVDLDHVLEIYARGEELMKELETERATGALITLRCWNCEIYFTVTDLKTHRGYPICPDCNGKTRGVQYWY